MTVFVGNGYHLVAAGCRCVLQDQPGFGRSDPLPGPTTLDAMIAKLLIASALVATTVTIHAAGLGVVLSHA